MYGRMGGLSLVNCVQHSFEAVKSFWKRWGICTLRCARSKTPIAVFWMDPYEVWTSLAKKKVGVILGILHTNLTLVGAKLPQI